MPKDSDLGRALATALTAAYVGKIKEISFTYDTYVELDNLKDEPYVFLHIESAPQTRQSRAGTIQRDAVFRCTSISKQGPTEDPSWTDAQLESLDMLIDLIYKTPIGGKRPTQIEYEDRFDLDKFQSHQRLVADFVVRYANI